MVIRESSILAAFFAMAEPADEPKEVSDFKFKSLRKIRIHGEAESENFPKKCTTQKLAVANSLGIIFAGKIKRS